MSNIDVITPVRKTVRVRAPIARAFDVFTSGLTRWWPPRFGISSRPIVQVRMETKLGGRWIETADDGSETIAATIIVWEPPRRVVLLWQIDAKWQPNTAMKSEVDIRFTEDGPTHTIVDLLHHKFETMGAEAGASMRRDVAGGWPGLLDRFISEAEAISS